jgi:hypothetical protein
MVEKSKTKNMNRPKDIGAFFVREGTNIDKIYKI